MEGFIDTISYRVLGELQDNPFKKHESELEKLGAWNASSFEQWDYGTPEAQTIFTFHIEPSEFAGQYRLTSFVNKVLKDL